MTAAWLGLLLGARVHGVVDRVEGRWLVVEWEGSVMGDVPSELVPTGVGEGDRLVLRTVRGRCGPSAELYGFSGVSQLLPPRSGCVVVTVPHRQGERRRERTR